MGPRDGRGPRGRWAALLALVLVGVGIGFALRGSGHAAAAGAPGPAADAGDRVVVASAVGPTRTDAGVPVGFARSREGAEAAARTMADQTARLFTMTDAELAAAVGRYSASSRRDALVERVRSNAAQFREVAMLAPGPELITAVISAHVDSYTDDRAGVDLYAVQVLVSDAMQVPMVAFGSGRYELVWEDGDWHLWSITDRTGPNPMPAPDAEPTDTARFRQELPGGREPR